jgi:hypothetical protein
MGFLMCCCGGLDLCNYTEWPDNLYLTTGGKTVTLTKTWVGGTYLYQWRGQDTFDFAAKTADCLDPIGYPSLRFQIFCYNQILYILYYCKLIVCGEECAWRSTVPDWNFDSVSGVTVTSFDNSPFALEGTWTIGEADCGVSTIATPLGTGTVVISETAP